MTLQSVGFVEPAVDQDGTVEERIYQSCLNMLVHTLGWSKVAARGRALQEVSRLVAKQRIEGLLRSGWFFHGKNILDVGSGHGSLAVEMSLHGANVTALEPCASWRQLSEERACELGLSIRHLGSDAEAIPFPDHSFDACVCLQVLEHVRDQRRVIQEISRVLKPGGRFLICCENYLAFRDQEYGVWWFPALPKVLGSLYLHLLGRDPGFLRNHIHYTYWPLLVKWFIEAGMIDRSWEGWLASVAQETSIRTKSQILYRALERIAGPTWAKTALLTAVNGSRVFGVGFGAEGEKRVAALR